MRAHAPEGYRCPFCLYASGGENEYVAADHFIERTASTFTFISPRWWLNNPGHLLVVPTLHVESLYELPDGFALPLQQATRRAALALKGAYGCPGTSTRQHNEPDGGQDVWHYHVHVFPRYPDDGLYGAPCRTADRSEMSRYAESVRRALPDDAPA